MGESGGGMRCMKLQFSRTRYSPIAVDLGGGGLKLLQVELPSPGDTTTPPTLVAAARVDLPEDVAGHPAATRAWAAGVLPNLVKRGGFKGKRAMAALPSGGGGGGGALVQHLELTPAEAEAGLEEAVQLQLQLRLNIDPSRMVIRHVDAGISKVAGRGGKRDVVALGATRETVMGMIEMLGRARLQAVGLHSGPTAVLRAFERLYNRRQEDQTQVGCFIDLGATSTTLVIAHGHEMKFAKCLDWGGSAVVWELAATRGIAGEQARSVWRAGPGEQRNGRGGLGGIGGDEDQAAEVERRRVLAMEEAEAGRERSVLNLVPMAGRSGGGGGDGGGGGEALTRGRCGSVSSGAGGGDDLVERSEAVEHLLDELRMCIRYYAHLHPDRPVDRLVFTGGEARRLTLCQHLARSLRVKAQLGDPFARLRPPTSAANPSAGAIDPTEPQPGFAVPLGVCLSEANL